MEREFIEICRAEYRLLDEKDDAERKKLLKRIYRIALAQDANEHRRILRVLKSMGITSKPLAAPEREEALVNG